MENGRPQLAFRHPARRYWLVFLVVIAAIAVVNLVTQPSLLRGCYCVLDVGGAAFMAYRTNVMALTSSGEQLTIRNFRKTHVVPVKSIRRLDIGRSSDRSGLTLRLVTELGAIPIDIFARSRHPARSAQMKLERRRQELLDWLWNLPGV